MKRRSQSEESSAESDDESGSELKEKRPTLRDVRKPIPNDQPLPAKTKKGFSVSHVKKRVKQHSGLHITCIHINALVPVPHILRFRHLPLGCLNLHQYLP